MKIYIDNYKPIQLLTILSSLEKFLYSCEEYIEIYCDSGQYIILKENVYQVLINDVPITNVPITNVPITNVSITNKNCDNNHFILDNSSFELVPTSHVPNNHISIPMNKYIYKMDQNPFFFLVIEGAKGDQIHFIPSNFYFEYNKEKISLENCIDELNEFLFILNKS